MLLLLPLAGAVLLWVLAATHAKVLGFAELDRRGALMVAFVLFELVTLAVTELTSLGHHYTKTSLGVAWLVVDLGLVAGAAPSLWRMRPIGASTRSGQRGVVSRPRPSLDVAVGSAVIGAFFGVLVLTGWLFRPSNSDSMFYHLARIEHWIQNETVGYYATHYTGQIELAPLFEYNVATLHLFLGTDRLDGFVQLAATGLCVLGASELARRLGLAARGQVLAGLLVITIPGLVLEATSTTNDAFTAAIGVAAAGVLTAPLTGTDWWRRGVALGAVTGLAEVTKGTVIGLLGPATVILLAMALRSTWRADGPTRTLKRAGGAAALAALTAVFVASPFLIRNYDNFGGPGGPLSRSTINDHQTPGGDAGNVLRTTAAQFLIGDGSGFQYQVSRFALRGLKEVYDLTGQDPNDPAYALIPAADAFKAGDYSRLTRSEEIGADPWQVVLVGGTMVVLALGAVRRRELRPPLLLACGLCLGYLAFAMTAKWSIYANRYYIALLVMWAPLVAVAIARLPRTAGRILAALLIVACLPQLFHNASRSLIPAGYHFDSPLEPYFLPAEDKAVIEARTQDYESLTKTIAASSCHQVGLVNAIILEYPIWVGLQDHGWHGTIEDVGVRNASRSHEDPSYRPCALIGEPDQKHFTSDHPGLQTLQFGSLTLFIDPASRDPSQ